MLKRAFHGILIISTLTLLLVGAFCLKNSPRVEKYFNELKAYDRIHKAHYRCVAMCELTVETSYFKDILVLPPDSFCMLACEKEYLEKNDSVLFIRKYIH